MPKDIYDKLIDEPSTYNPDKLVKVIYKKL